VPTSAPVEPFSPATGLGRKRLVGWEALAVSRVVETEEKRFEYSHPAIGYASEPVDLGLQVDDACRFVPTLKGGAVVGSKLLFDHGDSLPRVVVKPPEGPKIGAKQPVSETMIFRLHWIGFSGRVGLVPEHEIPRFTPDCTARHWRALLFVGLLLRK
jgi:hypothetical protein